MVINAGTTKCSKCGRRLVSLGVDSQKWNKLSIDQRRNILNRHLEGKSKKNEPLSSLKGTIDSQVQDKLKNNKSIVTTVAVVALLYVMVRLLGSCGSGSNLFLGSGVSSSVKKVAIEKSEADMTAAYARNGIYDVSFDSKVICVGKQVGSDRDYMIVAVEASDGTVICYNLGVMLGDAYIVGETEFYKPIDDIEKKDIEQLKKLFKYSN